MENACTRFREISAMAEYCDPDLMLITETKLDSSIFSSELLPKGYVGEFRRDRNLIGGGVMIVTKYGYTITDLVLPTATQNETELVLAIITLKDHYKLEVGAFYLPPNNNNNILFYSANIQFNKNLFSALYKRKCVQQVLTRTC